MNAERDDRRQCDACRKELEGELGRETTPDIGRRWKERGELQMTYGKDKESSTREDQRDQGVDVEGAQDVRLWKNICAATGSHIKSRDHTPSTKSRLRSLCFCQSEKFPLL